ncbi:hypothetical protein E2C01_020809 [Portunus trituberculatus]|uniref:Uncharacterized protein n=1 Tax=Portunus trituberculatus TaxID=210409 RepID=A0A5B7E0W2_PORTR|nr:hypothetical protein [Portunus trituberculatus]
MKPNASPSTLRACMRQCAQRCTARTWLGVCALKHLATRLPWNSIITETWARESRDLNERAPYEVNINHSSRPIRASSLGLGRGSETQDLRERNEGPQSVLAKKRVAARVLAVLPTAPLMPSVTRLDKGLTLYSLPPRPCCYMGPPSCTPHGPAVTRRLAFHLHISWPMVTKGLTLYYASPTTRYLLDATYPATDESGCGGAMRAGAPVAHTSTRQLRMNHNSEPLPDPMAGPLPTTRPQRRLTERHPAHTTLPAATMRDAETLHSCYDIAYSPPLCHSSMAG